MIEERLAELEIELPPSAAPVASYVPVKRGPGVAFVSGQVPMEDGAPIAVGKLGAEIDVPRGQELARRCALQALAALRDELGSLDAVKQVLKVTIFVASTPGFSDQPKVGNGASDLLVEVFGDTGRHARAAVGCVSLPLDVPVEVELTVEI